MLLSQRSYEDYGKYFNGCRYFIIYNDTQEKIGYDREEKVVLNSCDEERIVDYVREYIKRRERTYGNNNNITSLNNIGSANNVNGEINNNYNTVGNNSKE